MGYEWFDRIDQVVWELEAMIESATQQHTMLGMAPSAGDEARACLRRIAGAVNPLALIEECEDVQKSGVSATNEALATAAVDNAVSRGSRHVTREDVASAISAGIEYPYSRS